MVSGISRLGLVTVCDSSVSLDIEEMRGRFHPTIKRTRNETSFVCVFCRQKSMEKI